MGIPVLLVERAVALDCSFVNIGIVLLLGRH
jgi:hypothetical protein